MSTTEKDRIRYLLVRFAEKTASGAEEEELYSIIEKDEFETSVKDVLRQLLMEEPQTTLDENLASRIINRALQPTIVETTVIKRNFIWNLLAAASIMGVLAIGGYWLFKGYKKDTPKELVRERTHDVKAPESNRATLELADGSVVLLDSLGSSKIKVDADVQLIRLKNGEYAYQSLNGKDGTSPNLKTAFNTLSNPRGSKVVDLQLSDGTHIWLNAGSSISYPVIFSENDRKVILKGEGYFEVAKNLSKKGENKRFIVQSGAIATEVLGTHFNVSAYAEDDNAEVTLLEGSVSVSTVTAPGGVKIHPGQQARLRKASGAKIEVAPVPVEQYVAWKNGYFSFSNTSLKEVLEQASRWYDIEIKYTTAPPDVKFSGEIGRTMSLSQFLKILTSTRIRYKLEGKNLIINN